MRSILANLSYPRMLLAAAVRRIRAEHEVTLCACRVDQSLYQPRNSLRKPCRKGGTDNVARRSQYEHWLSIGPIVRRAGKLRRKQIRINATIRDRYYGAASSTPVTVFSTLLKLKNHHLSKLDNRGRAMNLEKRIGEIMDGIGDFPGAVIFG